MMEIKSVFFTMGLVFLVIGLLAGCTSNPVGKDKIGAGNRKISGRVQLDEENHPDKVYVWLEGFEQGVFTNENGQFSLTLPSGVKGEVTGVFKLYFFVANYKLDFVEVVLRNGEFVFDEAGLNAEGELRQPKRMQKFLSTTTEVEPSSVRFNDNGGIRVNVELQTVASGADTVTVVFPNTSAGFLGPIFVQNVESEAVFIFESLPVTTREVVLVGVAPVTRSASFSISSLNLPPARYRVIPFMHIMHEEIPPGLLESIGSNLKELTPNYLMIPWDRDGGDFEVTPAQ
ncbi:MAG: hypothetical protein ACE5IY_07660 [bacterium]